MPLRQRLIRLATADQRLRMSAEIVGKRAQRTRRALQLLQRPLEILLQRRIGRQRATRTAERPLRILQGAVDLRQQPVVELRQQLVVELRQQLLVDLLERQVQLSQALVEIAANALERKLLDLVDDFGQLLLQLVEAA